MLGVPTIPGQILQRRLIPLGVGLLCTCALARAAEAGTTYHVSTEAQLQSAVAAVVDGDSIVLAPGFYALTGQLNIDADITVQGDPLAPTVIDAGGGDLFSVRANNISIQNLTLQNAGTAIDYEGEGVFMGTGVTITGSNTAFSPGDSGGSTFFTNSTIAHNTGDGIVISCAELHLTNVTVSGNGTGVDFDFPCGEQMQLINSLIVGNGTDCGGGGSFAAVSDASFDSDGSCVAMGFAAGLTTRNPMLGALTANGGPTLTEAIPATSPAVNAGDNGACPPVDQRGFARSDGACDIGAYEFGAGPGGSNTPIGVNVAVSPAPGVTVTFSQVAAAGDTTATTGGPQPPTGFQVDGVVYDISTTAVWQPGTAIVCLPYSPTIDPSPRLYHDESGVPVDRTTSVDTVNHIVCATVTSLSPFAVLFPSNVSAELQQLQLLIDGFNLGKPAAKQFRHRLDDARKAWAAQKNGKHPLKPFCAEMDDFVKAVNKASGKSLTAEEAGQLLLFATQIEGEAGC